MLKFFYNLLLFGLLVLFVDTPVIRKYVKKQQKH